MSATAQTALDTNSRIPLSSFAKHVENMHLNENCGFFAEYKVSILSSFVGCLSSSLILDKQCDTYIAFDNMK